VTNFTAGGQLTLPIWIYATIGRGRALPQVNAVALLVILLSLVPVSIAQRLADRPAGGGDAVIAGGADVLEPAP
jgi:putative spermidine/putrescine transport system permease protein